MTKTLRPLKVFLCYSHVDRSRVKKKVYDRLVHDGVEVWMDKENLHGGKNWEIEIRKVVRDSDIFIACVSAEFTKQYGLKKFNQTEVGIALQEAQLRPKDKIFIVPVRLEECAVPKKLSKIHWIDLFEAGGYRQLIRSLNQRIEQLGSDNSSRDISIVIDGNFDGNIIVGDQNVIEKKRLPGDALRAGFRNNVDTPGNKNENPITPYQGARIAFVCSLIVFFGGLLIAHRMVGTPFVPDLAALFQIASGGTQFYYPDLNALLFDILIHPSAFAMLVFLKVFTDKHPQVFSVTTSESQLERVLNWVGLVALPIGLGIYSVFSAFETRYQYYELKQPLLAAALLATGLAFAGITALSSRSLYTAWNLVRVTAAGENDTEKHVLVRTLLLMLLGTIFILIAEAGVMWWTSVYKGALANDFLWIGTSVICILTVVGLSAGIFATNQNMHNAPKVG